MARLKLSETATMTAADIMRLIDGIGEEGGIFDGDLDLSDSSRYSARDVNRILGSINIILGFLDIHGRRSIKRLGKLRGCYGLNASNSGLSEMPIEEFFVFDASDLKDKDESVPYGILNLSGCGGITKLPNRLWAPVLNICGSGVSSDYNPGACGGHKVGAVVRDLVIVERRHDGGVLVVESPNDHFVFDRIVVDGPEGKKSIFDRADDVERWQRRMGACKFVSMGDTMFELWLKYHGRDKFSADKNLWTDFQKLRFLLDAAIGDTLPTRKLSRLFSEMSYAEFDEWLREGGIAVIRNEAYVENGCIPALLDAAVDYAKSH